MKKFLFFLMALLCLGGAAKADSYTIYRDKLPV